MPHYVVLVNWTDQGIRNVRETIQRVEAADALEHKHGLRTEQIYWTVGPYDTTSGPPPFAPTTAKRCPRSSRGLGLHRVPETEGGLEEGRASAGFRPSYLFHPSA
jgi:hypothetical protein